MSLLFEQQLGKACQQMGLDPQTTPLYCALSGGADSVALLLGLQALGFQVKAAHCNFQLRGSEADQDQAFVETLCREHHIPLFCTTFQTRAYARTHHLCIEAAARELRYAWFDQLVAAAPEKTRMAIGHHVQDQVETFFLQLMRGAGLKGLSGMSLQEGHYVRPMLHIHQETILAYLEALQQPYCTDATNYDTTYRRNALRHDILPLLRQMQPQFDRLLSTAMMRMGEADRHLEATAKAKLPWTLHPELPLARLHTQALATAEGGWRGEIATWLYYRLSAYGVSTTMVEAMAEGLIQKRWGAYFQTHTHEFTLTREAIEIAPRIAPWHIPVVPNGRTPLPHYGVLTHQSSTTISISHEACRATIDEAQLKGPLVVRPLQKGDRFQPFGMKGSKLLSNYLTDRRCSRLVRSRTLCVCDDKGIVWVVGHTIAQRVAITATSSQIGVLEYLPSPMLPQ